jgi:branched-chain amino acid transport system permease protein
VRLALATIAALFVVFYPQFQSIIGTGPPLTTAIPVLLYVLLALGLNVVVGFAGLLDLGYAAFFAIGAYTVAFLTSSSSPFPYIVDHPVNFFVAMAVSTLVAAIFGVLLGAPTLRLRGDYLAIVTLGFGEIVPLVVRNTPEWTRGTQGMNPIGFPALPAPLVSALADVQVHLGPLDINGIQVKFGIDTGPWYYLVLAVVAISVIVTARLRTSRIGRAWMAIREDEVAAASMGINPVTTKLFAFSLGASFSGFAGSVFASYLQVIAPEQFRFDVSIFVLSMIILGGMGNIWGVILGGILLGLSDRMLPGIVGGISRTLGEQFDIKSLRDLDVSLFRSLAFGLVLVIMMRVRPEGLFPSARRKMELHAAEESAEEAAQQRATLYETQR